MPRADVFQSNFTSGEISPAMLGRSDITKYFNGAQRIENFYVKPQGGAFRRMGTQYVGTTKSNGAARLIPFEFNNEQAYVLEFGNLYVRIWRNDGGMLELLTDGANAVELTTPYPTATLDQISFAQSADVLYLAHPDYSPRKFARASAAQSWADYTDTDEDGNVWNFGDMDFINGPYEDYNSDWNSDVRAVTFTDQVTLELSTGSFTGTIPGPTDVGKYIEYRDFITGQWRLGQIATLFDSNGVAEGGVGVGTLVRCTVNVLPVYTPPDDTTLISHSGADLFVTANYSGSFQLSDTYRYVRANAGSGGSGEWFGMSFITGTSSSSPSDKAATGSSAYTMKTYSWPTAYLKYINTYQAVTSVTSVTGILTAANAGRWLRLNLSGKILFGKISGTSVDGLTGTLVINDTVNLVDFEFPYDETTAQQLQDAGQTRYWSLGAWGGSNGWPALVAFHEERLVFARTDANPQGIWFSVAGDYENFSPTEQDSTVLDDSAISITLSGGKANYITWLQSGPTLLAGTIGGVWDIRASGTLNEPLTPTNIKATLQSGYGSVNDATAQRVGDSVFYIQRGGRKLRETRYNFDTDSFLASDATIISEHIFRQGDNAERQTYQPDPNSIIWFLLGDGTLAAMTYDKDQEVYAWFRYSFGDGTVESFVCVPDDTGEEWQLWLIVNRTIDGSTVRYVEVLGNEFNPTSSTDKTGMKYVDSWISKTPSTSDGVTTVSDLDHLEGETVEAVLDGAYDGEYTVSGGEITLTRSGTTCIVGIPYTSTIKTVPYEGGNPLGTSQGRVKSVPRVSVRLLNSLGFKFGQSESSLNLISFRNTTDTMDTSPALFTGDKEVYKGGSYDGDGSFFIVQDQPYPLNVLAIMPELVTHG